MPYFINIKEDYTDHWFLLD